MPLCPNCCSPLKKRNNSHGKYYHCTRHGFVRDIGTPEPVILTTENLSAVQSLSTYKPKHLKLNIEAQNA